jgi:hypothetical protein
LVDDASSLVEKLEEKELLLKEQAARYRLAKEQALKRQNIWFDFLSTRYQSNRARGGKRKVIARR